MKKILTILFLIPCFIFAQGSIEDISYQQTSSDVVSIQVNTSLDENGVLNFDSLHYDFEFLGWTSCKIFYTLQEGETQANINHSFEVDFSNQSIEDGNCGMNVYRYINNQILEINDDVDDFVTIEWCWLYIDNNLIKSQQKFEIYVYSLWGQLIEQKTIDQYDLRSLKKGTYILSITQEEKNKRIKIVL